MLKALGGEARYRRVDATLMLLAANDTKVGYENYAKVSDTFYESNESMKIT